jgi:glycosyltransferase involved in cell wall biosynthesis
VITALDLLSDNSKLAFQAFLEMRKQQLRLGGLRMEQQGLSSAVGDLERSLSWKLSYPLRLADAARRRFGSFPISSNAAEDSSFRWMNSLKLSKKGPELAIDVSRILLNDSGTGIQRVVRNITRELVSSGIRGESVALDFRNGDLLDVSEKCGRIGRMRGSSKSFQRLLMLDSSWDIADCLTPLYEACHVADIPVIACVHDLIPIDFAGSTSGDLSSVYRRWLNDCIEHCDAFVCVSQSTSRRLESYIRNEFTGIPRTRKIGWWRLGSELEAVGAIGASAATQDFLLPPDPYVLCVGTFEPRKNQRFLLEAFSKWWRDQNFPISLVFAGRDGWKTESLIADIENHREFGRRLWWFRGVEDDYLQELYRHSSAVVMASSAEGFGLPVVEGARFGKPIVLSDIPVFREIVADQGYFFAVNQQNSLREALDSALASNAQPTRVRDVSWRESAQELYELVVGEKYQIKLQSQA